MKTYIIDHKMNPTRFDDFADSLSSNDLTKIYKIHSNEAIYLKWNVSFNSLRAATETSRKS